MLEVCKQYILLNGIYLEEKNCIVNLMKSESLPPLPYTKSTKARKRKILIPTMLKRTIELTEWMNEQFKNEMLNIIQYTHTLSLYINVYMSRVQPFVNKWKCNHLFPFFLVCCKRFLNFQCDGLRTFVDGCARFVIVCCYSLSLSMLYFAFEYSVIQANPGNV